MTDPTESLAQRLERVIATLPEDRATSPLSVSAWEVPGEPPAPAEALPAARFEPAAVGDPWGPAWGTTWFRLRGTVPSDWRGGPVEVHLDLGFSLWPPGFQCEGLVVDAAGRPLRGVHPRARRWLVIRRADGGEAVEALVEAAANPSVTSFTAGGADAVNRVGGEPLYRLAACGAGPPGPPRPRAGR